MMSRVLVLALAAISLCGSGGCQPATQYRTAIRFQDSRILVHCEQPLGDDLEVNECTLTREPDDPYGAQLQVKGDGTLSAPNMNILTRSKFIVINGALIVGPEKDGYRNVLVQRSGFLLPDAFPTFEGGRR